jgi:LmbE family N-acetylglucosaminyl deacetylase
MMRGFLKHLRRLLISGLIRSSARPCPALPTGKTLVIAPHPDDETFGCGGLIALKTASHIPVDVVFLTSGEASHNDCCRMDRAHLGEARRAQARTAAGLLGVTEDHMHWLGMTDGEIGSGEGTGVNTAGSDIDKLAELISKLKPDEIYCPHPLDCWPDHEATARLVLQATQVSAFAGPTADKSGFRLRQAYGGQVRSQVFFYLVWGWYGMQFRNCGRVAGLQSSRVPELQGCRMEEWQSCRVTELQGGRVAGREEGTAGERQLGRLRPVRVDISNVLDKKLAAIREYVGKHPAGCPHPYVGGLPDGFLEPFQKPYEIFFPLVLPLPSRHGIV